MTRVQSDFLYAQNAVWNATCLEHFQRLRLSKLNVNIINIVKATLPFTKTTKMHVFFNLDLIQKHVHDFGQLPSSTMSVTICMFVKASVNTNNNAQSQHFNCSASYSKGGEIFNDNKEKKKAGTNWNIVKGFH